jgi:hypothetical protein
VISKSVTEQGHQADNPQVLGLEKEESQVAALVD